MYMYAVVGVDETLVVTLKFSKDRMAVFTCSVALQLPNDAVIVGTKGTIKVSHQIKLKWSEMLFVYTKRICML